MADFPLTPRPQVRSTSTNEKLDVAARTVDQGAGITPAMDPTLMGLVEGLHAFNPALAKYKDLADKEGMKRAKQAGEADAQRNLNDGSPASVETPDAGFSGTFGSIYREAFRTGITERAADKARAAIISEYGDKKDLPDFDVDTFIANQRATHMQGLPDDMAGPMGQHLEKLEGAIRHDADSIRLKRLDETRESAISATLRNTLTADTPETVAQDYQSKVLPVILGMGKTRKEGAQYLFQHLVNLSDKAGGKPELFDALLTHKDAAGMTIFDANPALQSHIRQAKAHALQQVDAALADSSADNNLLKMKDFDDAVGKDPFSVNFEDLTSEFGKHGVFKSDNEVMSYWHHILKAREAQAGQNNLLGLAKNGMLYMAEEKDQKAVMGSLTGSVVAGLQQAIQTGDTSSVAALSDALITAHRTAGATVASPQIARMFEFIGTAAPQGSEGPPPAIFKAASEVYRALESKPELRNVYFKDDGVKVMKAYLQAVDGGAEPTAAFKGAYASISPEAKAREEAFKKTPEFTEKLQKATKWVTGSSWWPKMLGGNGRPENAGEVVGAAQDFALNYVKANPSASDAEVQRATEEHSARSFAIDATTGIAVRVPTGATAEVTQKALTAYTEKLTKEMGLDKREDGWRLSLIPSNVNQGTYRVATAFNGAPVHFIQEVKMADLVAQHRKDTLWLPEDAAILKNAELAMKAGQPVSQEGLPAALAKARQLGVQGDLVKQLGGLQVEAAKKTLAGRVRMGEDVDTSVLFSNDRPMKVEPKLTVNSAQRFLNTSGGGSTGLAASLITMGESVMLKAYNDPAQGAGQNIGMGYNLKANAATVDKDLRSAGVPVDRIDGIKNGSLPLSPEQAERLTLVAVGRHEAMANAQVNSVQPGLWEKLQPAQRAVLTDIAYQTGNVAQFKTAIGKLVAGDTEGFKEASKVHYTNRQGVKVEDKRRNALRNSMLSGTAFWQSVLQRQGAQPSSQLDSVALNQ